MFTLDTLHIINFVYFDTTIRALHRITLLVVITHSWQFAQSYFFLEIRKCLSGTERRNVDIPVCNSE